MNILAFGSFFYRASSSGRAPKAFTFPLRRNELNINMIGPALHKQLFKFPPHPIEKQKVKKSVESLIVNNLIRNDDVFFENHNFPLPKLLGPTLEEHFHQLSYEFCIPYLALAFRLAEGKCPPRPTNFNCKPGWTKYSEDGRVASVPYPDCDVLIFDVECSVPNNNVPVMATAVSDKYWYTWLSENLFSDKSYAWSQKFPREIPYSHLIPFGPSKTLPRLLIGHNVSFDRNYVKEEYMPESNFLYFLDTMSIHIMMRGYAEAQRMYVREGATPSDDTIFDPNEKAFEWEKGSNKNLWSKMGCFNSLAALSQFYLNKELEKSNVKAFLQDDFKTLFINMESLLEYCAKDVEATFLVFKKMWHDFHIFAPNPVTFAGMLMMSKCYIPLTENWGSYITRAQNMYMNYETEMDRIITKLAQTHVSEGLQSKSYINDPWLKYLDWSISGSPEKLNSDSFKQKNKISLENKKLGKKILKEVLKVKDPDVLYNVASDMDWFPDLPENPEQINRKEVYSGYPKWFKDLIDHHIFEDLVGPRPCQIYHGHKIIPTLLKLSWNGYPLYFHEKRQWGYLLPKKLLQENLIDLDGKPLQNPDFQSRYSIYKSSNNKTSVENKLGINDDKFNENLVDGISNQDLINERIFGIYQNSEFVDNEDENGGKNWKYNLLHQDTIVYDEIVPGFYFVPVPHPEGLSKQCGNPLGSEYFKHIEDGKLIPLTRSLGMRFIHLLQSMSFWKNNRDRIYNQVIVYFEKHEIPREFKRQNICGALLPKVVVAGTVTRRAVEKTWLTAINPHIDMIGSEFKSSIEAPDGFCFVGADVDSQEMWIASLIADASTLGTHGATPFSYMNLQGTKSRGTDLHSVTADAVGIDRDYAKILNYGRLYGAGMDFAKNIIKQYQPHLTENEAIMKAVYLYNFTKGIKCVELTEAGIELAKKYKIKSDELLYLLDFYGLMKKGKVKETDFEKFGRVFWQGGTESEIFNVLEEFAKNRVTSTPVLNVSIPHTLISPVVKDDFLTSRMNWVVQSSAVDFLHMFLVSCFWLFSILKVPARLVICIHDEIRFMVPEDKRYEAAFALHIGNLFTRAAFSQKLGIHDLPQSVAFFSSVEIDKVLRKEIFQTCQTPSNPEKIPKEFKGFKCI